jgi:hypothetical protein
MADKAPEKARAPRAPETVRVRMLNAHATSAGNSLPGDVLALPPDEAQPYITAGYAVRVS